jgi:aminopeptidase YwaD
MHNVSARISGTRAKRLVGFMDGYFRIPGNTGFNASIERVVAALEGAGYVEESSEPRAPLTYRVERRPMERPTWEPVAARLSIVGRPGPLLDMRTNKNMLAIYSRATPAGGIEGELVDVGRARDQDFEGVDVRGRIVFAEARVGKLFDEAVLKRGALGVLAYRIPAFNHPDEYPDLISFSSIAWEPEDSGWGILLSRNARDAIRQAMATGAARVRVEVDARMYRSDEVTLVAEVRGQTRPRERFVFSAHVQEPGANDNASGVAALAEIATALAGEVRAGAFAPDRTVTMIWGDEIRSTRRYLEEDTLRARGVRWGMSLDMVGEDTGKTGGTFLIEKMPDPSAIWTRGDDHHTEWGGSPLTADDLMPHYFNDFVRNRCLDRAAETDWVVRTNPFEGGSDHVPFLRAGVPGLLLWHFTDVYYHTDGDRVEMVSPRTIENVAVCAATSAMTLVTADADFVAFMADELESAALDRLSRERMLSLNAIRDGADRAEQRRILETWSAWYVDAMTTLESVEVGGPSRVTRRRVARGRDAIARAGREAVRAVSRR